MLMSYTTASQACTSLCSQAPLCRDDTLTLTLLYLCLCLCFKSGRRPFTKLRTGFRKRPFDGHLPLVRHVASRTNKLLVVGRTLDLVFGDPYKCKT